METIGAMHIQPPASRKGTPHYLQKRNTTLLIIHFRNTNFYNVNFYRLIKLYIVIYINNYNF